MISRTLFKLTVIFLFLTPTINFAQSITLGSAANFVLFSTDGALSNTGISQLTGNVGTNNGSSTAFGNVNGQMHDNDLVSAQAATDLLVAYNQLNVAVPTFFPAPLLGNGQILTAGVYSIAAASTLNLELTLDGNANSVFIFKIAGPLSTNANSSVKLLNGVKACNVFWKVEGLIDIASGTTIRGNLLANNAAVNFNTNSTLEGRAFSTAGAITVDGVLAYTPTGCGSPLLTGPAAPNLASIACYSLFSGNGSLINTGSTHAQGDVGTNVGLTSGFDPLKITGMIHPIPDASTATCAVDLGNVYTYLNALPVDIDLLYPSQFGRNLVLTPHTYVLNGATTFTDSLYLNAEGNANAVFVIKINGALETSTFSNVILTNGAQAKNIFWVVNGAVDINQFSQFNGSIIVNNGAVSLNKGTVINGRVYTTDGAFTTDSIRMTMPTTCTTVGLEKTENDLLVHVYPNPFDQEIHIQLNNSNSEIQELKIFNILGKEVMHLELNQSKTTIQSSDFPSGVYFYQITSNQQIIQTGRLVSQH